jgi:hypothetical protein
MGNDCVQCGPSRNNATVKAAAQKENRFRRETMMMMLCSFLWIATRMSQASQMYQLH